MLLPQLGLGSKGCFGKPTHLPSSGLDSSWKTHKVSCGSGLSWEMWPLQVTLSKSILGLWWVWAVSGWTRSGSCRDWDCIFQVSKPKALPGALTGRFWGLKKAKGVVSDPRAGTAPATLWGGWQSMCSDGTILPGPLHSVTITNRLFGAQHWLRD